MPIIYEKESAVLGMLPPADFYRTETEEQDPALSQVVKAAFSIENSLGSLLANESMPQFPIDTEYNPYDRENSDIVGYEFYADAFTGSQSREQTAWIKQKIDREIQDRQVIEAGGAWGLASSIAAGLFDPIFLPLTLAPGGVFIRSGQALQSGVRLGAAAGSLEAVAEVAKQETQLTRTGLESLINIGGATFLSGVLGSSASALNRSEFDALAQQTSDYLSESGPRSIGAAQAQRLSPEDTRMIGTGTLIEKVGVNPELRVAASESQAARETMYQLVESSIYTRGMAEGEVMAPPTGAVETRVKRWDANLGSSLEQMDKFYLDYRKQAPGLASSYALKVKDLFGARARSGQYTPAQFREQVAYAMRRGDAHEIPQVAQAAKAFRQQLFDPLKKSAQELGLLPDDVAVSTAPSYLTRVWNVPMIKARRPELERILSDWIVGSGGDALEAPDAAKEIVNNILGAPGGRIPLEVMPKKPVAKAGPLKERVLLIPDNRIEDFLDNDIERVAQFYKRSLAPEVELVRTFGDKDMRGAIQAIDDDYAQLRKQLDEREFKTDKARDKAQMKLDRQRAANIRDIEAMRDRLLGTYKAPEDPDNFFVRKAEQAKSINYMSKLGGQTLSALPDIARPVFVTGIAPMAKGLASLALAPKTFRMAMREVKAAGTAWDMVLNTRANSFAEITDMYGRQTKFDRGLRGLSNNFSVLTLMAPWNAAMKQFSGTIISNNMARVVKRIAAGENVSAAQRKRLALAGINEDMAKRVATQLNEHATDSRGIVVSGIDRWDDLDAIDAWRSAIVKDVDRSIITPGIGERPLWMSSQTGQIIGQFKSFAFASTNKILVSGLQQRDLAALNGLWLMLALASVSYASKQITSDRPISDDPRVWIMEAVDRSGMLGYLFDINNIVEKATRGTIGASALTGGPQMSRYASRNVMGSLLGPSFGAAQDVLQVVGAASTGDVSESDIRATRKLLPYQNLFYIRRLLDSVEQDVNQQVGTN
jgi:hypothetical protein